MSYKIEILGQQSINADYWNDLVGNSNGATPFSYFNYNSLFSNDDLFYILAVDTLSGRYQAGIGARIKGKLPLLGRTFATVLAETSVLVNRNVIGDENNLKNIIYSELITHSKRLGVIRVFLNHWSRESDRKILEKAGYVTEKNPTFEISAGDQYETVFKGYSYSCRNTIRKATGKNVKVKIFSGIIPEEIIIGIIVIARSTFRRAYSRNQSTSMQLKSFEFYDKLFRTLPENSILGVAYSENTPVSFAIGMYNKERSIYYRGGSDLEGNRMTGASNLLIDSLIRHAIAKNISIFDMGGIPHAPEKEHPAFGVYKFKQSFGGSYKEYYSGIYIISPARAVLFDKLLNNRFLISIYNKLRPVN